MSQNTISVSPLPQSTTIDKIKEIFSAFSVKNVHIDGNTAYVEFADQGDLQNLDIQFDNYEVADLNNAKIDKTQFDWNTVHKQTGNFSELKSQSSDKHQDLMAADLDNLIVIENCDQQKLNSMSIEAIRQIFKDFHSVNRIVKRNNDVIVQFTDGGEMEKLQGTFNNLNVPQLGYNSQIQKADNQKISPQDFVNQWSKIHNQSMITQESTNLGYKEEKPTSGEFYSGSQLGYGSMQEKPSPAHKVLHEDIIPPFDKKTSMEVNFLSEQSQLGYRQEPTHEAIPQATTHQQLDYTTEVKIHDDEHNLGYSKEVEDEARRRQQEERKRKQEEQIQRKLEEQRIKHQEQEHRRKIELQQQQKRVEQEQRKKKQEEQRRKRQQQQDQRKREEQQARKKKQEQQLQKQRQQQEQRKKQEEQQKRKQQEQKRKREEQQAKLKLEQERKRKFQQERLSQQLKQKLDAQKQKYKAEHENLGYQQETKKQQKHQIPTESENAAQQTQALREVGQSIEKQLGYAVNMAKAESAHLLQAGLDLLKGTGKEQSKEQPASKTQKLGYEKEAPKEIGLNLINSGLQFLKGSYQKFQEHFGQNAVNQQGSKSSDLGYEKWSVKPDVSALKPASTAQSKVLRTLVTVTLLIWVIFLLMQDTSQQAQPISEIEITTSTI